MTDARIGKLVGGLRTGGSRAEGRHPVRERREEQRAMTTLWEPVGGQPFFDTLVGRFYQRVERDPVLRPLYPRTSSPDAARSRCSSGSTGVALTTTARKRDTHACACVTHRSSSTSPPRDAWLAAMLAAVDESARAGRVGAGDDREYFTMASTAMINAPDRSLQR